ncbi:hypothetical protein N9037_02410 [Akkermansiaceae bacterium]|nr:hypothetical protein [Akkermansiaceae bacterium]
MSEREKKLLLVLGVTFFLILNFIGFNMLYLPEVQKAGRSKMTFHRRMAREFGTNAPPKRSATAPASLTFLGNAFTGGSMFPSV